LTSTGVVRLIVVGFLDLLMYSLILSLFLKYGPGGAGPRLFQLMAAVMLVSLFTYGATFRKRKAGWWRRAVRPTAGVLAAGALTPSFLQGIPLASIAAAAGIATLPYWGNKATRPLKAYMILATSPFSKTYGFYFMTDLLLAKRVTYVLRCQRGIAPTVKGVKAIDTSYGSYLSIGVTRPTTSWCRRRAVAKAAAIINEGRYVLVPATEEETEALRRGLGPPNESLENMKREGTALATLVVACARSLSCWLVTDGRTTPELADVVIRREGSKFTVDVLSGGPVVMDGERLRFLLDIYGMIRAR
jgi:hypothetical protein